MENCRPTLSCPLMSLISDPCADNPLNIKHVVALTCVKTSTLHKRSYSYKEILFIYKLEDMDKQMLH